MKTGNPNSYPFDSYDASFFISTSILSSNDSLPLTMFTIGAVQDFTYTTQFQGISDDGSAVSISFHIQRVQPHDFLQLSSSSVSAPDDNPSRKSNRNVQLCGLLVSAFSLLRCQFGSEARTPNFLWFPSQLACFSRCPIYETVNPASLLQLGLQKIVGQIFLA